MSYHFPTTSNLCYLLKNGEVLLAMKKRGFGVGKWNGPGGKVGNEIKGESLDDAVRREVLEETGYQIEQLEPVGLIEFVWPEEKGWNQRCYIYICREFSGNLAESDECLPFWFKISEVPYSQMWDDDQYWLDGVLKGGKVNKRIFFDGNGKVEKTEEIVEEEIKK
ncbi:MAG: 8-oxo-dGTP diphosphatase [Patescibacteria group bacterium]